MLIDELSFLCILIIASSCSICSGGSLLICHFIADTIIPGSITFLHLIFFLLHVFIYFWCTVIDGIHQIRLKVCGTQLRNRITTMTVKHGKDGCRQTTSWLHFFFISIITTIIVFNSYNGFAIIIIINSFFSIIIIFTIILIIMTQIRVMEAICSITLIYTLLALLMLLLSFLLLLML